MALCWYEYGKRKGDPWLEKGSQAERTDSSHPYQRQLDPVNLVEEKITQAKQLMKGPVRTINPTASLKEAQSILKNYRIRHLPIVNTITNTFEGIVSDRDILRELAAGGDTFLEWVNHTNGSILVSSFMTKKVLVAPPEEKIVNIARAMFSEKLGCMPIVDDTENLVGIITRSDILRLIMRTAPVDCWL